MKPNKKLQILLTNDDSIDSPGLWAAAEALAPLGFVHVVAPRVQQTSMGRALPRESDGIIEPRALTVNGKEWQVYAVGGSPAQAFLHGYYEVLGCKPDLVVSGINYGENVASGITISGTVGAALEAATLGIPALAVSLETPVSQHFNLSPDVDFSVAGYFTRYFAEKLLNIEMPFDVGVLKVDVPNDATPETPWVVTRQSRTRYFYPLPADPEVAQGSRKLRYEVRLEQDGAEPDSDLHVVKTDRKVSVTPLSFDLTARVDLGDFAKLLQENP
ncbi:MAG TPA: 5'/3'-nucleotidase SurE [Anaerolineaceae bacterium]|jgi:5'-nucleotidase|nr:5'/3'-nucleotidase SurE [Anaerolineaceae bacterium]HOR83938.1 5'/3'-nucleotidase SurE [Anaerolineaceae bacterium]HPL42274.1 5'/3'-nucleotidase SurE [Anaerolineaceae bacterium]